MKVKTISKERQRVLTRELRRKTRSVRFDSVMLSMRWIPPALREEIARQATEVKSATREGVDELTSDVVKHGE